MPGETPSTKGTSMPRRFAVLRAMPLTTRLRKFIASKRHPHVNDHEHEREYPLDAVTDNLSEQREEPQLGRSSASGAHHVVVDMFVFRGKGSAPELYKDPTVVRGDVVSNMFSEADEQQDESLLLEHGDFWVYYVDEEVAVAPEPGRMFVEPTFCLDAATISRAQIPFLDSYLLLDRWGIGAPLANNLNAHRRSTALSLNDLPSYAPTSSIMLPHLVGQRTTTSDSTEQRLDKTTKRHTWALSDLLPRKSLPSQRDLPPVESASDAPETTPHISKLFLPVGQDKTTRSISDERLAVQVRNLFAVLHHQPLIGSTLSSALAGVRVPLDDWQAYPDGEPLLDRTDLMIDYIISLSLHDVRNNFALAFDLLTYCESDPVKWRVGYIETFAHCAGMLSTPENHEFIKSTTALSEYTKYHLIKARDNLERDRVYLEAFLKSFDVRAHWPIHIHTILSESSLAVFMQFQEDLVHHYRELVPTRPRPAKGRLGPNSHGKPWLKPAVLRQLHAEFAALYAAFGDQRKTILSLIIPEDDSVVVFGRLLEELDKHQEYPRIEHPFPLIVEVEEDHVADAKPSKARRMSGQMFKRLSRVSGEVKAEGVEVEAEAEAPLLRMYREMTETGRCGGENRATDKEAQLVRWAVVHAVTRFLGHLVGQEEAVQFKEGCEYFVWSAAAVVCPWEAGR